MKMVFDSDFIQSGWAVKNAILDQIIDSGVKLTVIHGPAGSGKSTLAAKSDAEIIGVNTDLSKATEFVVISGASKTKSGQPSDRVIRLIQSADVVIFVVTPNMEIIKRRWNRIENGAIDKRNKKQLRSTLKAPLNKFDFISVLKKMAKKSMIVKN